MDIIVLMVVLGIGYWVLYGNHPKHHHHRRMGRNQCNHFPK